MKSRRTILKLLEPYGLSPARLEVAALLVLGYSNEEIALRLEIAYQTARAHRVAVYRELGVSSQPKLMARFLLPLI